MGHRRKRDTPTKGRRIHATDDEWSRVQAAASRKNLSVSAYVVQVAQTGKVEVPDEQLVDGIRLLTACHGLLTEIADRSTHESDTDAAVVAAELADVAALLEAFMATVDENHDARAAGRCC